MPELRGRLTTTPAPDVNEVPGWVLDLLVAIGQAIAVALIIAIGSLDTREQQYGAYLFAGSFGALLLLRRVLPTAVLVCTVLGVFAYYAVGYPPIGMAVPAVAAFYAAAAHRRVVVASAMAAVLLAVSLYFRSRDGESGAVLAYDLITNVALIGCAIALALMVRSRRSLRDEQERVVALERERQQDRAAGQVEAERLRIARDVHDSIGHALSLVSVQARVAQQALDHDHAAAAGALGNVVAATRASLSDLRRTLAMLQAAPDSAEKTPVNLRGIERTAESARDAGLDVEVHIDVDPEDLPGSTASTAFRIVQESVTNVLRHAHAHGVTISVGATDGELRVRVVDDGQGADPGRADNGHGINGMRERAALIGGSLTTRSSDSGFAVEAVLPLEPAR